MRSLTIGQMARRAGVGIDTVRFYERQGLLMEPPRRRSGSCCLPLGFAAALGAGAASALLTTLRPWLLGISMLLLGVGFWQQRRARQCPVRRRWLGEVLLWLAVAVVLGMLLLPQQIAGLMADGFWRTGP